VTDPGRPQVVVKAVVAAATLVYVIGLAVVTLHLAKYGIANVGLVQAQFVPAGVMALVPIVAVAFLVAVVVALMQHELSGRFATGVPRASGSFVKRRDMVVGVLGAIIGILGIARFFFGFVGARSDDVTAPLSVGEILIVGLAVLGFVAAIAWGVGIARYARTEQPADMPYRVLGWSLALAGVIGYIGYFTSSVFPRVPAAAGGGAPTAVHIVMRSDSEPVSLAAAMRGLPQDAACRHRLLFATRDSYIVVDPRDSTNAIEIARELVAAVRSVTGRVEPCARPS
jgi:hypothetical protein